MTDPGPRIAAVALSHSPPMAQDTEHVQGSEFRRGFAEVAESVKAYDPSLVAAVLVPARGPLAVDGVVVRRAGRRGRRDRARSFIVL